MTTTAATAMKFEPRAVFVRIDGKPVRLALLVGEPRPGFYNVQLSRGGRHRPNQFRAKVHRIMASEMVRDATARELELGHFDPTVNTR